MVKLAIAKAYIRHYTDNGQRTAYVEHDKGRTEGSEVAMRFLLEAARRQGVPVTRETW